MAGSPAEPGEVRLGAGDWWDSAAGRFLVGPGPVGPDGQRLVNVRGCAGAELRDALAELLTTVV